MRLAAIVERKYRLEGRLKAARDTKGEFERRGVFFGLDCNDRLSGRSDRVAELLFMLQKEVVDRMVAAPGSGDYGRLSVMLQYRFHMERLFVVPPGAFDPAPQVDSAIVRMIPIDFAKVGAGGTARDPDLFARLVAAAFSQRRKMLRNTLKEFGGESLLEAQGIAPTARAETLAVADYVRLANALNRKE